MSVPMTYISDDDADAALDLKSAVTYWAAMHTDDPDGSNGFNEGVALPRVEVETEHWSEPAAHPSGGRAITYEAALEFGAASVTETYTYMVLWDDPTDGNVRYIRRLVEPRTVETSETLTLASGYLKFRVGGR